MITKATAVEIWRAYDEISRAEELIASAKLSPDNRSPFDRSYQRVEMGIPFGDNGTRRILDVTPGLALGVIQAHIAECRARLVALGEVVRAEMSGGVK